MFSVLKNKQLKILNDLQFAINSLESQQMNNQHKRNLLLQEIEYYRKLKENTKNNTNSHPICNICFSNNVNIALIPCGHLFCIHCFKGTRCYICRKNVTNILHIYF